MRIYLDCIPCLVRQALDASRLASDDEQLHAEVLSKTLEILGEMDMSLCPPAIAQRVHRLLRSLIENEDPYCELKKQSNEHAMRICEELDDPISSTKKPLETAIKLAIAGNIIDLGVKSSLPHEEMEQIVDDAISGRLSAQQIKKFENNVADAQDILYLADNAGEIAFDRILLEQLPLEKVTVVVKGTPIINDATMEDAEAVGLTDMVEVIDNGSDAPGTILSTCSESFRKRFAKADLIISKGQGNYESLSHLDANIFFALRAKCPVIARDIGCEIGDMIFRQNKRVHKKVMLNTKE